MLKASKQSANGYWIEPLKKNVYSLEEINYFIYNHMDLVYRDFFSDELFDYLENELDNPEMAEHLRGISSREGTIGDFVRCILNGSYYYNSRELAEISMLVSNIDSMGKADRLKIQGDAHYRAGKYNSALQCYLEILRNAGSEQASGSFYGRVAYAVGSIYARMFMSKSANTFFSYAYDYSPDPQYARACIYMSILADDDEELLASIVRFKITDDELEAMKNRVRATRRELECGEDMAAFRKLMEDPALREQTVDQWKAEYYTMMK